MEAANPNQLGNDKGDNAVAILASLFGVCLVVLVSLVVVVMSALSCIALRKRKRSHTLPLETSL